VNVWAVEVELFNELLKLGVSGKPAKCGLRWIVKCTDF